MTVALLVASATVPLPSLKAVGAELLRSVEAKVALTSGTVSGSWTWRCRQRVSVTVGLKTVELEASECTSEGTKLLEVFEHTSEDAQYSFRDPLASRASSLNTTVSSLRFSSLTASHLVVVLSDVSP